MKVKAEAGSDLPAGVGGACAGAMPPRALDADLAGCLPGGLSADFDARTSIATERGSGNVKPQGILPCRLPAAAVESHAIALSSE